MTIRNKDKNETKWYNLNYYEDYLFFKYNVLKLLFYENFY